MIHISILLALITAYSWSPAAIIALIPEPASFATVALLLSAAGDDSFTTASRGLTRHTV
jgi:hypothetical protein